MHIPRHRFVCGTRRAERLSPGLASLPVLFSSLCFLTAIGPTVFSAPLPPPLVCMFDVQLILKEWVIAHALVTVCARMLKWTATRPVCPRRIGSRTRHVTTPPFPSSFTFRSFPRFFSPRSIRQQDTNHEQNIPSTMHTMLIILRKLKHLRVFQRTKDRRATTICSEHRRRERVGTASLLLGHRTGECNRTKIGARTWRVFPVPLDRRQRVSPAYQSKCAST